ncbi:SGNH/GDSL hydrolase family protein [Sutcliffiella cohnii]
MKKIIGLISVVLLVLLTIVGKVHYDRKIAVSIEKLEDPLIESSVDTEAITSNMSEDLRAIVLEKLTKDEVISTLIIGSRSISTDEDNVSPWPYKLQEALHSAYGENKFYVDILNFEDISTHHLIEINGHLHAASFKPDIVILEPLLMNDNGIVTLEDSINNINLLINTILTEAPDAYIMLQPANPIPEGTIYVEQNEELKRFAADKGYEYLDHWENWKLDELQSLVSLDLYPTEKGHEVWAEFLIKYFIFTED